MSIERPDIACILICAKKVHNEAAEAGMGDAQRRYELSLVSNFINYGILKWKCSRVLVLNGL